MMKDASEAYSDIIDLPHFRSARHIPMPRAERAAQFSSFAALSGHGDAIRETARLTDARKTLSESAEEELDASLRELMRHPEREARVSWFVPDARKTGGSYRCELIRLRRVDPVRRCLILSDGATIPLSAVSHIELMPNL